MKQQRLHSWKPHFRDRALMWYMKYKATAPVGQARSLTEIKRDLLKEFQNLSQSLSVLQRSRRLSRNKEKPCGIMTNGSIFCWIG
jgi:hypothetical protein